MEARRRTSGPVELTPERLDIVRRTFAAVANASALRVRAELSSMTSVVFIDDAIVLRKISAAQRAAHRPRSG